MRFRNPVVLGGLVVLSLSSPAAAQERITFNVDMTFYGDNTEFFNPWREGETLLGTESRLFLDVELNEFVTLRGGIFGDHRFGDDDNFETVRPVLALHLQNDYARFVIGSRAAPKRWGWGRTGRVRTACFHPCSASPWRSAARMRRDCS